MAEERARTMRDKAEEAVAQEMRRLHESGEISHLYGQPLELDDDPEWLVTKVLKQQGYSHPLLEAARDLDEPRQRANEVVERLVRRYRWLTSAASRCTEEQVLGFNELREHGLQEYRERLTALNRAIRDYNLSAPEALHQRPVSIDTAVKKMASEIPPLAVSNLSSAKRRLFRR
jgi:DNA repair ATPase RecN